MRLYYNMKTVWVFKSIFILPVSIGDKNFSGSRRRSIKITGPRKKKDWLNAALNDQLICARVFVNLQPLTALCWLPLSKFSLGEKCNSTSNKETISCNKRRNLFFLISHVVFEKNNFKLLLISKIIFRFIYNVLYQCISISSVLVYRY